MPSSLFGLLFLMSLLCQQGRQWPAANYSAHFMSILEVSEVERNIAETFSLKGISFTLDKGQKMGVAGATGSGKSTLLKIIAGLDDADAGTVHFETKKVRGPKYRLIPGQPGVAYLSQHYELRNHYRMEELLSYANTMTDVQAHQLFELCKISHLLKRNTFQLSGGEKQRIALARLLLTSPRLLILDEPFSNLDLIHKSILKQVLKDIGQDLGLTCIIASHDPLDLLSWADSMLIVKDGELLQEAVPKEIYFKPAEVYAGALLGKYNLMDAHCVSLFLPGIDLQDKQLFVRPEQLSIAITSSDATKDVAGIIDAITFYGNYYELTIQVQQHRLLVIVTHNSFQMGQQVYLQLKTDRELWRL
jgi:ABC-type sugar transport system ATPase subunit